MHNTKMILKNLEPATLQLTVEAVWPQKRYPFLLQHPTSLALKGTQRSFARSQFDNNHSIFFLVQLPGLCKLLTFSQFQAVLHSVCGIALLPVQCLHKDHWLLKMKINTFYRLFRMCFKNLPVKM